MGGLLEGESNGFAGTRDGEVWRIVVFNEGCIMAGNVSITTRL